MQAGEEQELRHTSATPLRAPWMCDEADERVTVPHQSAGQRKPEAELTDVSAPSSSIEEHESADDTFRRALSMDYTSQQQKQVRVDFSPSCCSCTYEYVPDGQEYTVMRQCTAVLL